MRRVAPLCVVLFAACSDAGATRTGAADAAVADAIPDIGGDTGEPDTSADTETDSEPDTTADTEADAEPDTTADTETDTVLDTITDTDAEADADTATDAEADTTADTEADTTIDTTIDTALDTISDTEADADTATDAEADTTADTEADTTSDTAVEDTGAEPACGNGVVETGESCDDGASNSDSMPGACRTGCLLPACGDLVVDPDEACDDGNAVTEGCSYGLTSCTVCDSDCTLSAGVTSYCGDGAIDSAETCDDGPLNDELTSDACRRDCTLPACGDGTRDSVEACDDGNLSDRDQCTSTCELGLGRACAPDGVNADCLSGWCSNGFCAPEGMAFIPPGTFQMGSPDTEFGRNASDENLHEVTLTRPFYMDLTETTQGSWRELAGPAGNPSFYDGLSPCDGVAPDSCPVESLGSTTIAIYANARSDDEGLTACYTLSGCSQTLTGGTWQNGTYNCSGMVLGSLDCNGYRLPTEAEWEYAYRAGTTSSLYNGDATTSTGVDPLAGLIAVYVGNAVRARTGPVGQYSPNAWGLYDMAGNVQEWVEDRYTARLRDATDPINTTGSGRVIRGGFYGASASGIRAAYRIWFGINLRDSATGFRLVRTVTPANLR